MIDSPTLARHSTALIAGCGYVGLRAARLWNTQGIRTFAITRSQAKASELEAEGIRAIILDLGSASEWPPLPDADIVLWSVGFDRRPGAERKAIWIDGLQRLLAALPHRPAPRRIIYTSSTGVYGDGDGKDIDELTPPEPCTEGGSACMAAEQILQEFARATGNEVAILRLAGIYGPDRLLRRVSELRERVPLATEPDDWLNLIHVEDAVRAIDFVGRSDVRPGRSRLEGIAADTMAADIMNVVAAGSVTRRTYYSTLAKLVSAPEPIFAPPGTETVTTGAHRRRGGNRRVISRVRPTLPIEYQFDDCGHGLARAVAESTGL